MHTNSRTNKLAKAKQVENYLNLDNFLANFREVKTKLISQIKSFLPHK